MKRLKNLFAYFICFSIISQSIAHKTPGYSHENHSEIDNSKWMSIIDNQTLLLDISIPGTHDTMSLGHGGIIAQCQSLPLETQLKSGIRALDIRCRHFQNMFAIHHGIEFQHIWFGDVVNKIITFLQKNPSEVVLMRLKEEYEPFNNTRTFEETFEYYAKTYKDWFWMPNPTSKSKYPTLGETRGKIVILDNFSYSDKYGLNYYNNDNFTIQDKYEFRSNWDLYEKWIKIKEFLQEADASRTKGAEKTFFVNYLSGSYGAFPYFVASGHLTPGTGASRLSTAFTTLTSKDKYPDFPRVDCVLSVCTIAFEGTNVLTYVHLNNKHSYLRYVGIIMADFPGDGLINSIIELNFKRNESNLRKSFFVWPEVIFTFVSIICFFIVLCICRQLINRCPTPSPDQLPQSNNHLTFGNNLNITSIPAKSLPLEKYQRF